MKRKLQYRLILVICSVTFFINVTGCGMNKNKDNVKYILTTGFSQNEIFRIENQSCYLDEMMLYLTNMQNQYEQVYGAQIWETTFEDETLEDNVKDVVLARLAQLKCMQLLAKDYQIGLDDEEMSRIKVAAKEYYQSLNETEIKKMDISLDTVEGLYTEYLLATKVYRFLIQDVNPEISDDEARSIKVQSILIKTNYQDESGRIIPYTEYEKKRAYEKAKEVIKRIEEGESFESLVDEYNEDNRSIYSFGKGDMDEIFEKTAYNLNTGEISEIVETQYGYHIIKCLSTFDEDETNANKAKILEQRKNNAFHEVYNQYVVNLIKYINEDVWNSVTFIVDPNVTTSQLFEIYSKYFEEI